MTEMQRRVADLTGIPVHADEAMAKSGGRGKTLQKTMRFLNGNILKPYFFRCFHKRMLWIETIIFEVCFITAIDFPRVDELAEETRSWNIVSGSHEVWRLCFLMAKPGISCFWEVVLVDLFCIFHSKVAGFCV